ncbi:MAG: hypothetical protein JXB08_02050 [Bacilli bacterium]|nr:hypothetical protein [Bacilli bacterium]
MMKKNFTLSLVAMIGSVLLFVVASFAWFAISDTAGSDLITIDAQDIDIDATLYVSDDGINYSPATEIDFQNTVPGDIKYYKVEITNNNDFTVYTQVSLHDFTDSVTDPLGDDSNYLAGRSLMDVIILNSDQITDQLLTTLLIADVFVITHEAVEITASSTEELFFSFTISGSAGNDYQNLQLDIDHILVQSTQ